MLYGQTILAIKHALQIPDIKHGGAFDPPTQVTIMAVTVYIANVVEQYIAIIRKFETVSETYKDYHHYTECKLL